MNLLKDFDGSQDKSGKKLLLHFFGGIGDMLWRTCLLRELKKRNPKLYIAVSSNGPHWKLLFKDNPHIDELVEIEGDKDVSEDWDYYITDRLCPHVVTDYGKQLHCIDAIAYWAGLEITDKSYVYEVTKEERKWAKEFVGQFKPQTVIGFAFKGSSWIRRWDPLQVERLTKILAMNGYRVILLDDHPCPWTHKNITKMTGGYNIRDVAAVIEQVDYVISCDTGAMHLAGHLKRPTIVIFCGTSPELRSTHYSTIYPMVPPKELCPEGRWPCFLHTPHCNHGIPVPCALHYKAEDVYKKLKEIQRKNK